MILLTVVLLILTSTPVGAAQPPPEPGAPSGPEVADGAGGTGQRLVVEVPAHTMPTRPANPLTGILPRTGGGVPTSMVELAAGLILAGSVLVVAGRRRTRSLDSRLGVQDGFP